MRLFPKIASPCPYTDKLDAVVVDDWCGMCKRRVVDLTDMRDHERKRLLSGCDEDVPCTRYSVPVALAAASLALSTSAMAHDLSHSTRHARRQPVPVAPPPVSIPTAGVPALPVQWQNGEPVAAEPTKTTPEIPRR